MIIISLDFSRDAVQQQQFFVCFFVPPCHGHTKFRECCLNPNTKCWPTLWPCLFFPLNFPWHVLHSLFRLLEPCGLHFVMNNPSVTATRLIHTVAVDTNSYLLPTVLTTWLQLFEQAGKGEAKIEFHYDDTACVVLKYVLVCVAKRVLFVFILCKSACPCLFHLAPVALTCWPFSSLITAF